MFDDWRDDLLALSDDLFNVALRKNYTFERECKEYGCQMGGFINIILYKTNIIIINRFSQGLEKITCITIK